MDLKRDISMLAALMLLLLVGMSGGDPVPPESLNVVEAPLLSADLRNE